MVDMVITFQPHWVNRGWLRTFTQPYVTVDGVETKCDWSAPTTVRAEPGPRTVQAFVRYPRLLLAGGVGTRVIDVPRTGSVRVVASNWLTNQSPFVPRVVDPAPDA